MYDKLLINAIGEEKATLVLPILLDHINEVGVHIFKSINGVISSNTENENEWLILFNIFITALIDGTLENWIKITYETAGDKEGPELSLLALDLIKEMVDGKMGKLKK